MDVYLPFPSRDRKGDLRGAMERACERERIEMRALCLSLPLHQDERRMNSSVCLMYIFTPTQKTCRRRVNKGAACVFI